MIDSNVISIMINSLTDLESTEGKAKSTLDELIKLIVKVSHESEDIQDELKLYGDMFFHIYIPDIDYNIWIKKVGATLTFHTSYYEKTPDNVSVIHFLLSKKVIKRIFTQRLKPADAFMRGLIKVQGELSDAMITKNLLKVFFDYLNYYMTKNSVRHI